MCDTRKLSIGVISDSFSVLIHQPFHFLLTSGGEQKGSHRKVPITCGFHRKDSFAGITRGLLLGVYSRSGNDSSSNLLCPIPHVTNTVDNKYHISHWAPRSGVADRILPLMSVRL